ncbi:hypothetical protein BX600DRAFT_76715 [Xylariales sp. PMI_506]|nr:hypothetical protein BX600DRAFT_76715 [Xylariales sp. PMI_506]
MHVPIYIYIPRYINTHANSRPGQRKEECSFRALRAGAGQRTYLQRTGPFLACVLVPFALLPWHRAIQALERCQWASPHRALADPTTTSLQTVKWQKWSSPSSCQAPIFAVRLIDLLFFSQRTSAFRWTVGTFSADRRPPLPKATCTVEFFFPLTELLSTQPRHIVPFWRTCAVDCQFVSVIGADSDPLLSTGCLRPSTPEHYLPLPPVEGLALGSFDISRLVPCAQRSCESSRVSNPSRNHG